MKDTITKDQVKHVANLARLTLTDKELDLYTKQLQGVLEFMEQLKEVDTSNVEPTFQTLDNTKNIFREDKKRKCLSQKDVLSQASKTHKGYFLTDSTFANIKKDAKEVKIQKRNIDDFNSVLTKVDSKGTLGHKDLFMTKDIETTAGSAILEGYHPQFSATVVQKLKTAGFKIKYKLNEDAWGHGSSGENSDYGATQNPWDTARVPGGSSSGSGAALAAGLVDVATGTDTCGSIRMPSSYSNVCGIKPTYGAVSRYGVIAFASSLDCPGVMARSVAEVRKAYDFIVGPDQNDATSLSTSRSIQKSKAKVIGIPKEFFTEGIDNEVKKLVMNAIKTFESNGYKTQEVSLPHSKYGIAAYYIIAPTETSSNLARYDGVRFGNDRSRFGAEAKRRIMLGCFASSAGYSAKYYEKAARVRTLLIKDLEKAFEEVDAIIGPVSPTPPFKIGEKVGDPLKLYLMDIYAAPASLSGLPSLALSCGFTQKGLPVGMQIIGPRWSESRLFDLGDEYQKLTDWHTKHPKNYHG